MNQEEFKNWLKALDMYEFIDWLFPEVVEEEFNEEMYNAQINLYIPCISIKYMSLYRNEIK